MGIAGEMVIKGDTEWQITPTIQYTYNQAKSSIGTFDLYGSLVVGDGWHFGGNVGIDWTTSNDMFSLE